VKILITGGAGYIGSHLTRALLDQGFEVIIFDNLSTGHKEAVLGGEFFYGDRRAGDPPVLIADATKIKNELNWEPEFSNLKIIISHALSLEVKSKFC
jgi:UDP-glucose 4-epimerase